jgi:hypothetical protein
MITLTDDKRTECFQSLTEAVEAAKTWYPAALAPKWEYKIESFNDLFGAIEDYKACLAQVLR